MWSSDQWFADLKPELKLLFIYLFSNDRASVCGLYELPLRVMAFETRLDEAVIREGLEMFGQKGKAYYDMVSGVVWVRNMFKYQGSGSPKLLERIKADLKAVPDCALKENWIEENSVLIGYGRGKDTSLSVSVSVSSSVSEEGGGAGEETNWIPETPKQAASHPDIKLYEQITGRFPGDRDYETIITTLQHLRKSHPDLQDYLSPFWTAWSSRKTKDNKPYSRSSLVWLGEWAMQGEVPKANEHEPTAKFSPIPDAEATRRMLEERDKVFSKAATGKSIKELAELASRKR